MGLFVKKRIPVEAFQWLGPFSEVAGVWREETPPAGVPEAEWGLVEPIAVRFCVVTAHEQRVYLKPGDWVLTEPDGRGHYPCADDIFRAHYEPLTDALKESVGHAMNQALADVPGGQDKEANLLVACRQAAARLIEQVAGHFASDTGLRRAFSLVPCDRCDPSLQASLGVLEVNDASADFDDTIAALGFRNALGHGIALSLIEVSPRLFALIESGRLALPNGWKLGVEITPPHRPASCC